MDMLLKDRLAKAMTDSGFGSNQSDLARACGVRPSAINMLLSGATKAISAELLFKAARALKVNAEWLGVGVGPERGIEQAPAHPPQDPIIDALDELGPHQATIWRKRIDLAVAEKRAADAAPHHRSPPRPKSSTA